MMGLLAAAVIWFTLLNDINSTLRYEYYRLTKLNILMNALVNLFDNIQ